MKRTRAKSIICIIVAIAAVLAMLPLNAVGVIVRAAVNDAPWFNPNFHSFTLPSQGDTSFTSKSFAVTNPDFADGTVTEFSSDTATGWDATTSNNAVIGVVDTNLFDAFKASQNIAELDFMEVNPLSRTGSPNVLVLANNTADGTATASFTQRLDEFWADGYFRVQVCFYVVGSQNESAIYLIPETPFEDGRKIPSVGISQVSLAPGLPSVPAELRNTSQWQTAEFYVKTDMLESVTFSLGLYLGGHDGQDSRGVVYYDNVRVTGFSAAQFASTFAAARQSSNPLVSVVDLSRPAGETPPNIMPFSNTRQITENFENQNSVQFVDWNFTDGITAGSRVVRPSVRLVEVPSLLNVQERFSEVYGNTRQSGNTRVMLLSAVDSTASLRFHEPIRLNRSEIYMISFYALASDDGSTFFRIRDVDYGRPPDPRRPRPRESIYNSGFMPIKLGETSSSPSHNNWILNTIFVTGDVLQDNSVNFEFWVGGEDDATGFLMIDDFAVTRVSAQYFRKHKDSINSTECNLRWQHATPTIDNAHFNLGSPRSSLAPFPLVAESWEVNLEGEQVTDHMAEPANSKILNGIVNTCDEHWGANKKDYGSARNPFEILSYDINNNVYMMQNVVATHQTVKSNSFTLTSDTSNVIEFDAATYNLSNREVWAIVEVNGREVTRLPLVDRYTPDSQIRMASGWTRYSISVRTSQFSSPSTRITFALGSPTSTSTGVLYLDNVNTRVVGEDEIETGSARASVDLRDPSKLFMRTAGASETNGGESLFFVPDNPNTASAHFNVANNVLHISTLDATHAIVHNTMTEQLSEEVAYEYTVRLSRHSWVRFVTFTDFENQTPEYGLSLRIRNMTEEEEEVRMDGGFINLKTEDLNALVRNNEITLTFFIKSGTSLDLSLEIEFGNENARVEGSIGILGLELKEYVGDFDALVADERTSIITTSTRTPDQDDNESTTGQPIHWSYILSAVVMAVAIIFAIVGFTVRRMRFKRHIGKHHTSYARDDFETKIPKKDKQTPIAKKARKLRKPEDT